MAKEKNRPEKKSKPERKEKIKKKKRFGLRKIKFIIVGIFLLGLAFLFIADPLFNLGFGIVKTKRTAASHYILENARPIFALQSVEYTVKSVFPYDYIGSPDLLYSGMKKLFLNKQLSEEEKAGAELYMLLADIDFPVNSRKHEFIVVNVHLRAGYRFSIDENTSDGQVQDAVKKMIKTDTPKGMVTITLPDPEIVEVIIEDPSVETYQFPDISFSPAEWKKVAIYISDHIKENKLVEQVLAEAAENTRALLSGLFENAGWEQVVYINPEKEDANSQNPVME